MRASKQRRPKASGFLATNPIHLQRLFVFVIEISEGKITNPLRVHYLLYGTAPRVHLNYFGFHGDGFRNFADLKRNIDLMVLIHLKPDIRLKISLKANQTRGQFVSPNG